MLNFNISYWGLINFPYFSDTTQRGDSGVKERVTLQITLMPEFVIIGVVSFEIHEVAMGGLVGTMVKIPKFI